MDGTKSSKCDSPESFPYNFSIPPSSSPSPPENIATDLKNKNVILNIYQIINYTGIC